MTRKTIATLLLLVLLFDLSAPAFAESSSRAPTRTTPAAGFAGAGLSYALLRLAAAHPTNLLSLGVIAFNLGVLASHFGDPQNSQFWKGIGLGLGSSMVTTAVLLLLGSSMPWAVFGGFVASLLVEALRAPRKEPSLAAGRLTLLGQAMDH